jgi:hypothetical protein
VNKLHADMTNSGKLKILLIISGVSGLILLFLFRTDVREYLYPSSDETPKDTTSMPLIFESPDTVQSNVILEFSDGKQVPLSQFPDTADFKDNLNNKVIKYLDLDKNGKQELYLTFYTGGMHCCNESYVFSAVAPNHFREVFAFTGGSELSFKDNMIIANFYEQTAYFYTCYACMINDTLPRQDFDPHISLVYEKDSIYLAPVDKALNETILENLHFLKRWTENPDFMESEDPGVRKSFAEHIITYFFNNQNDINHTRSLFSGYYAGKDSLEVWEGIEKHLDNIFGMDYASDQYARKIMEMVSEIKNVLGEQDTTK